MERSLGIVIPCFNEEKRLKVTVTALQDSLKGSGISYLICIIDDFSTDQTWEIAKGLQNENIVVHRLEQNLGKGAAIKLGFQSLDTQFVSFVDADGDIAVDSILYGFRLLNNNPDYSGCIGSKRHSDSVVNYPPSRVFLSKIFSLYVRALFGLNIRDTQTGVKIFRKSDLQDIFETLFSEGFAFDLELCAKLCANHKKLVEIPVRIAHSFESTVTFKSATTAIKDTLRIKWELRRFNQSK